VKEDVLPNGIKIPANTRIGWDLYSMARVPEFWGNDCTEWKPERWFEKKELPPGLFAPFVRKKNKKFRNKHQRNL